MAPKPTIQENNLVLPLLAARPVDIGRLAKELESIDNTLHQQAIRKETHASKMPPTSRLMDQLVESNKIDLLEAVNRKLLAEFLVQVRQKAPVMHMSFSADPSSAFLEKLVAWLRKEIHPNVLLTIGLQPNIGAGCILRTTNKHFDMSLRQNFAGKRDLLMAKLAETTRAPEPIK